MADLLGFLAGGGMLVFIGALFLRFLLEIRVVQADTCRLIRRGTILTLCAGAVYWLCGGLTNRVMTASMESIGRFDQVFHGPYIQHMFSALQKPEAIDPVSGVFVMLARIMGTLLFGRYQSGGLLLAWALTAFGSCMLLAAVTKIAGKEAGEYAVFFMLCLPGAVFFFLPGWAPFLPPLIGGGSMLLARKKEAFHCPRLSDIRLSLIISVSAMLSAAVTAGLVMAKLG